MYTIFVYDETGVDLSMLTTCVQHYINFKSEQLKFPLATQESVTLLSYLQTHNVTNGIYLLSIGLNTDLCELISLSESIRRCDLTGKIIFLTPNRGQLISHTIEKNIEFFAVIDILSPADTLQKNIHETIQKAENRLDMLLAQSNELIVIKSGYNLYRFDLKEVLSIETNVECSHQLKVHSLHSSQHVSGSLKSIHEQYSKFLRVSRSHLINPNNVSCINFAEYNIYMIKDHIVPMSRRYKNDIKKYFSLK